MLTGITTEVSNLKLMPYCNVTLHYIQIYNTLYMSIWKRISSADVTLIILFIHHGPCMNWTLW